MKSQNVCGISPSCQILVKIFDINAFQKLVFSAKTINIKQIRPRGLAAVLLSRIQRLQSNF